MKIALQILLSCLLGAAAHAQFVEEVGTLESLYEARARAVLNSFMRPSEYTIVISAEIERDAKKLQEYQEKVELQFIPGLPIPQDPSMMPATNDLHNMKSRVTVNLILNTEVPPEKESLLKTILYSKLHLDEGSGDSVIVSRAKFPEQKIPPPPEPEVLPEFTWKTWALIVLLALLALAAVVFWSHGRSKNAAKKAKEPVDEDSEEKKWMQRGFPFPFAMPFQGPSQSEECKDDDKSQSLREQEAAILAELSETKDQLVYLVSQYPMLTSRAVIDLMDKNLVDVANTFEYISWDLSRRIFTGLSMQAWGRLGSSVRNSQGRLKPSEYLVSVRLVYKHLLARFLEAGAQKDDSNPFAFLFVINAEDRRELLKSEPALSYAVIGLFCSEDELKALIQGCDPKVQEAVPLEMSKLQVLPELNLNAIANRLHEKLRKIKESPSHYRDGVGMAARILRSYTPVKEQEIYSRMKVEDPAAAERVRRTIVVFEDVIYYPPDIVGGALTLMDIDQMASAMFGMAPEKRLQLVALLPSKRAKMVERDIESSGFLPGEDEIAEQRRLLCLKIEEVILARGKTVASIWEQIDARTKPDQMRLVG